uniref:MurR/RpiR family transcriptional regulator n=1 Tax=Enterocloster bolteae TaxID=208479 RepID=UPI002A831DBA
LQARNIRSCDLALIVIYSGLTEEMITCAREARLREAPVITISRFEQSPLVRLADYNLAVAATELIFRSGAMSSRISQLNMIDILYTAYVHKRYDECMEQFRKTHIAKSEGPEENQNAL